MAGKKVIICRMNAEIISIGTELLLGHIVNTNTSFLCRKLAEIGIDLYHTSVVGDNPSRIIQEIGQAANRSDIIIITGGLGPTVDDVTVATIANLTDKKSIKWIKNKIGSAPGLMAEYRGKIIVCLPGPPRELEPMFVNDIAPYLIKMFKKGWIIKSRTIKITGLRESFVNNKVKGLLQLKPPTTVGIYAKLGEVDLKITSKAKSEKEAWAAIDKIERKIRSCLKDHIFGYDDETLESCVNKLLIKNKKTIALAESCTGGLVSDRLTNVGGSSKYFIMGLVAYSNEVKENILCVDHETIKKYGAVSKQTASEMAVGIKLLAGSNIGVGITGIAGPTGGTSSKPVGLVYIALAVKGKLLVRELQFRGSREEIKFQASQVALDMIRKNI